VLRTEAVEKYPAMLTQAARTDIAGQTADVNAQRAQAGLIEDAQEYVDRQIGPNGAQRKKFRDLQKQDKIDNTNTAQAFADQIRQGYIDRVSAPPPAAPASAAASAAPAAAGTRPDISSVTGAPRGATIGAQTSRGWEIKDRSGKVIGYAQ
jgi:hypothetical protein